MALNGSAILLSLLTAPSTYTVIPCQTSGEYSLSVETIDTSCKDSPDSQNMPGSRSRSISVETIPGGWPELATNPVGAEQIIRHAAETGLQVQGRILVAGQPTEQFTATITSYSLSAPREESTTCSIELELSGAPTPIDPES